MKIRAVFQPKRTDNLRDQARPFIGQRLEFEQGHVQDEGYDYAGQHVWWSEVLGGWAPDEDLEGVEELP